MSADRARRTSIYAEGFKHSNPVPAASRIGPFIFSGVITGRDSITREMPANLEVQCANMFASIREIIVSAGGSIDDIAKVDVWLRDVDERTALNHEWESMFPDPSSRPARHSLPAVLSNGQLVQCSFIAVVNVGAATLA